MVFTPAVRWFRAADFSELLSARAEGAAESPERAGNVSVRWSDRRHLRHVNSAVASHGSISEHGPLEVSGGFPDADRNSVGIHPEAANGGYVAFGSLL